MNTVLQHALNNMVQAHDKLDEVVHDLDSMCTYQVVDAYYILKDALDRIAHIALAGEACDTPVASNLYRITIIRTRKIYGTPKWFRLTGKPALTDVGTLAKNAGYVKTILLDTPDGDRYVFDRKAEFLFILPSKPYPYKPKTLKEVWNG